MMPDVGAGLWNRPAAYPAGPHSNIAIYPTFPIIAEELYFMPIGSFIKNSPVAPPSRTAAVSPQQVTPHGFMNVQSTCHFGRTPVEQQGIIVLACWGPGRALYGAVPV